MTSDGRRLYIKHSFSRLRDTGYRYRLDESRRLVHLVVDTSVCDRLDFKHIAEAARLLEDEHHIKLLADDNEGAELGLVVWPPWSMRLFWGELTFDVDIVRLAIDQGIDIVLRRF